MLHSRVHLEENSPSDRDRRKSHSIGKPPWARPAAVANAPPKWLPNQLFSVYDQIMEVEYAIDGLPECRDIMDLVHSQRKSLEKEVDKYCSERSI